MGNKNVVIKYTPFPVTRDFHSSNVFVRGIMGPYGSGKSVACCMEIFSRAKEQKKAPDGIRRSRWAIVRNSYGELKSTTEKTWIDWFPEQQFGPIKRGSGPDVHLIRVDDVELEVLFLALDREDDARKLLSLELTGVWINEAREVSWPIIEAGLARVGRYPPKREGGPTWSGLIMDTNPPSTRHWWYQRFEVDRPDGWNLYKQPSGLSPKAENIENLPELYYERMMSAMDEHSIRAHVHGEYSLLRSGMPVFPQFKHSLHVAPKPLKAVHGTDIICGIDVGRTPAAVFLQEGYTGSIRALSEVTGEDISAVDFAERIKRHITKHYPTHRIEFFADPAFTQMSQTRNESVADILYSQGIMAYPASTNSIDIRLECVRNPLQQLDSAGDPMLVISPECEVLVEAMVGGYHYKELSIGGGRFSDTPDKGRYSHIVDALQYGILGAGHDPRYSNEDLEEDFKVTGGINEGNNFSSQNTSKNPYEHGF